MADQPLCTVCESDAPIEPLTPVGHLCDGCYDAIARLAGVGVAKAAHALAVRRVVRYGGADD